MDVNQCERLLKTITSQIEIRVSLVSQSLETITSGYASIITQTTDDISALLNNLKIEHINKVNEENEFDKLAEHSFNIFKDLYADKNFGELDHSRFLIKILDCENDVFRNPEFLKKFQKLIKSINPNIVDHDFGSNFTVEREQEVRGVSGKIDIFISDSNHSIIIENKITEKAGDQPNQLARYYEIAKKLGKPPVAIVYLPMYDKKPGIENYNHEYKDAVKEILAILPAISPISKRDLVHGFLDKCSELAKNTGNNTAFVCIDQYAKFIKSKGDREKMAKNTNGKILEKLLASEETIGVVEDIVEIWEKRFELTAEILYEKLKEKYAYKSEDICGGVLKDITDEVFVYFLLEDEYHEVGFGHRKERFNLNTQAELKKILASDEYRASISEIDASKEWVWGYYNTNLLIGTFESMEEELNKVLSSIEKKARDCLLQET